MVHRFQLSGSYSADPASGLPSGVDAGVAPLFYAMDLAAREVLVVDLQADGAQAINLAFAAAFASGAHLVIATVESGSATLGYNPGGGAQSILIDGLFMHLSKAHPLTSLQLTRQAGVPTVVHLFVGAKLGQAGA